MKTAINLCFLLLLAFPMVAEGQREGYVWAFGDKAGLDFNSGSPVAIATAMDNQFCGNATVSSPSGSLLFYTDGNRVWNRNHNLMPNGVLLTTNFGSSNAGTWAVNQSAVIAPVPGDPDLYYLFSLEIYTDGYRLWYSVIDMRMDNGFGAIAQAPVLLDPGALTEAMTVVRGDRCNFWLLVHERRSDQFRAYEINAAGVSGTPVVSHSGTLGAAIFSFGNYNLGGLKVAPNRRRLSGNWALSGLGDYYLELYDFDPMTGRVSNAIRIEGPSRHHYNTCFSPDNSKLYTIGDGWVHQFDLSLPTVADIAASKTDLLNGRYVVTHGDLKRGPDGKVYFIFRNVGAMHQINFPNLAGAACSVAHMTVPFVTGTNANWGLPNENLEALPPEDLLTTTRYVGMCSPDSVLLQADTPGINYVWSTTERTPSIVADAPGVYTVRYTHDCTHHLDTFIVVPYPEYPSLFNNGFSCIGRQEGMAWLRTQLQDTAVFTYTWMDGAGSVIRTAAGSNGDTLAGLDPGNYTVRVSTPFGCDTMYEFSIRPLPLPQVRFEASDKVCMDQPVVLQNTSDDAAYAWDFGDGSSSTETSPVHYYRSRGIYTVVLSAENADGCKDTFTKDIAVGDKDFLLLEADKLYADPGESVVLTTRSGDSYQVLAWYPLNYFDDQQARSQYILPDSAMEFTVVAVSEYGCIDTAVLSVLMNPVVVIPSAFTPNGDGKNDFFRPVAKGDMGVLRTMEIYNRWGELIWSVSSGSRPSGWDGTHNGLPAATGVYYYQIEIETPSGKQLQYKGDVTLIR